MTSTQTPGNAPHLGVGTLAHNRMDADGLAHSYGDPATHPRVLDGVSLSIGAHGPEAVAIMGPSGSGKSTLLHVLAGIVAPVDGRVVWRGRDLATVGDRERSRLRRTDFGFVFQSGQLLPELPAVENVALPLLLGRGSRAEAERRATALLERLGLAGLGARRPGELSGGQAQRVAIARALVGQPGIVFADEPTGALDRATGEAVMSLLIGATLGHGASLVVVTHDPTVAALCTRTIHLRDGRIVGEARADARAHAVDAPAAQAYAAATPPAQHAQAADAPGHGAPGHGAPAGWGQHAHPAHGYQPAPSPQMQARDDAPSTYGQARARMRVAPSAVAHVDPALRSWIEGAR